MGAQNQMSEQKKQKLREVAVRMYNAYHSWTCCVCGADVNHEEQVNSAVFAHPCGHYQWDGQARGSRPTPDGD